MSRLWRLGDLSGVSRDGTATAVTTRTCTICHQAKPLDEFYHHADGRNIMGVCKACHNARTMANNRRRQLADPEAYRAKRLEYQRAYMARHREAVRARERARRAKQRDRLA